MAIDENWAIPYFRPTVREALGDYLKNHGYSEVEAYTFQEIVYANPACRLTFHYIAEEPRPHSPMVSIGFNRMSRIGLWYVMPHDAEASEYETWRFDSAEQLNAVLLRLRDEVLEPYGRPLWEDPDRIRRFAARQLREIKDEQARDRSDRHLEAAASQFAMGRFEEALQHYSQVADKDLSAVHRKRMAIARHRCDLSD